jgi:hypothetical protein
MGLIRKAFFLGTAATGMPLVRWNSSAEKAAGHMQDLMDEQNSILSELARSQRVEANRLSGISKRIANPAPTSTPATEPSLTDRLTEINGLLERGLITEEEFSAMRKSALGL